MNAVLKTIAPVDHNRQKLIGGSDVAGILGISPWKTPLEIYLDKIRPRSGEPDRSKARIFSRGKRMEPYVVDMLAEEEGLTIVRRGERYQDRELPFLAAEIDAETDDGRNVEIKTVSPFKAMEWGEEQTDAIPIHYTAQAMHGLMVTGRQVCIFGVLIGGDDFRVYRIERDDETIAAIRLKEIEFWDRVLTLNPPPATRTSDVLALFERDSGAVIEANGDMLIHVNRLRDIRSRIKPLTDEAELIREQIELYMGDAAVLALEGKPLVTWKTQKSNRFDQAAFGEAHPDLLEQFRRTTESRVFRIK